MTRVFHSLDDTAIGILSLSGAVVADCEREFAEGATVHVLTCVLPEVVRGDAQPFLLPGDHRGVVCLHGFTATPYNVRYIAQKLAQSGMTVSAPTLPGHGTRPSDLARTTWRDWAQAASDAVDILRRTCTHIAIMGQSLGGLLALHTAAERTDIDAVMTMSAPLSLYPVPTAVARACARLGGRPAYLPKTGIDISDKVLAKTLPGYRKFPVQALLSLMEFMDVVQASLPKIEAPLLVLHSRQDHTAPFRSAAIIAESVSSRVVVARTFERSFHLLSVDIERSAVAAELLAFAEHTLGMAGHPSADLRGEHQ